MRSSLLLIATSALLVGCSSTDDGASAAGDTGGTMIIAPAHDAGDVFPPFVNDPTSRLIQDQVFDRLAEISQDLSTIGDKGFTPRLAQKWTWAADSMSIAFSLDPRARWHDGKPVTANDVRYSFNTFVDPKVGSPAATGFANIDSISVRDSLTPVVWFKKHTPEEFYDVAYQLIVMPEHIYGRIPADRLRTSDLTRTPIGSGRFRFVKWEAGVRLELIADTANFRGRPKLDRIIIAPADAATAATQLLTGQADFHDNFPGDQIPALDSSKIARPVPFPGFTYAFLAMNLLERKSKTAPHPIFGDIRVRRALAMAVDRQAMLKNVFGNSGRISHGPFPMTVSSSDSTLKLPPFDTVAAKAMLDSSGWKVGANGVRMKNGRPLRFAIAVPTTSQPRKRYAVLMQEQFRKVGVAVDIDEAEFPTVVKHTDAGDFDTTVGGFSTDPSPSGVRQNWGTAGIGAAGNNYMHYSNPKVDALLDSTAASFDPAKMKQYVTRAYQTIADDAPAIFLYDIVLNYGVNRRFDIAPMRADEWWANLADWSIPRDKRIDRDKIGLVVAKP